MSSRDEYTIALLEGLVSFVSATCADTSPPPSPNGSSNSGGGASYNSLSFKRKTTPESKSSKSQITTSSNPKEDKALFVTCGAFEMAVYLLRQVLEDHTNKTASSSWSRHKRTDILVDESFGVADSIANVQIQSTLPENKIPQLCLHAIACLAHNASDALKNDRILPLLTPIIHKSMMVFLPCPSIQVDGCWTLYSLSNPLLQELVASGSVSILANALKCHPTNADVQEHGNKALYNLLPLLMACYHNKSDKDSTVLSIEIDGRRLQDYTTLLPVLPAIVLRGMEEHPNHLAVQQYGLLVLTKLCRQDQETYEIVVSEGGLTALLHVVTMATTTITTTNNENVEQHDCLAQMACQFLRDLSRPTNSSSDILRIIAVKGGVRTVLRLLHHYNTSGSESNGFTVNIIDPAMACLRNLMTHEDNRSEIMTLSKNAILASAADDTQDEEYVHIVPIVLRTMAHHPDDAAIQAYGCDLLGRLAMGEETARLELIQSTIYNNNNNSNSTPTTPTKEFSNHSRLWKKASPTKEKETPIETAMSNMSMDDNLHHHKANKDIEDAFVTTIRAMKNHRSHPGVQDRGTVLLLTMVIDRDSKPLVASTYLVQRLQEVVSLQFQSELLAFLKDTTVSQKGHDRWKKLVQVVEQYDRKAKSKNGDTVEPSTGTNFFAKKWNFLAGGTAAR